MKERRPRLYARRERILVCFAAAAFPFFLSKACYASNPLANYLIDPTAIIARWHQMAGKRKQGGSDLSLTGASFLSKARPQYRRLNQQQLDRAALGSAVVYPCFLALPFVQF
jgi:hypothetical protein